jgi:hypothetical protein
MVDYEEIKDAKVVSICFKFDVLTFKNGDIKWIMFDSKERAQEKQVTEELQEPTVLQHFNVVTKNNDGFVLELQDGIEVRAVEVSNGKDV